MKVYQTFFESILNKAVANLWGKADTPFCAQKGDRHRFEGDDSIYWTTRMNHVYINESMHSITSNASIAEFKY